MAKAKTERPLPPVVPVVGQGVTYHIGSDMYAGTIIEVSKSGLQFSWQKDNRKFVGDNDHGDSRGWEFAPNTEAEICKARWSVRENNGVPFGVWRPSPKSSGSLTVGERRYYQDRDR